MNLLHLSGFCSLCSKNLCFGGEASRLWVSAGRERGAVSTSASNGTARSCQRALTAWIRARPVASVGQAGPSQPPARGSEGRKTLQGSSSPGGGGENLQLLVTAKAANRPSSPPRSRQPGAATGTGRLINRKEQMINERLK